MGIVHHKIVLDAAPPIWVNILNVGLTSIYITKVEESGTSKDFKKHHILFTHDLGFTCSHWVRMQGCVHTQRMRSRPLCVTYYY